MSSANASSAAVILLMLLQSSLSLFPPTASAQELSSCDGVDCGRGSCRVSPSRTFGFECECDAGWAQLRIHDLLRFLPCVIPKCTFSYSCYNESMAQPPHSFTLPSFSLLDPCLWSYCGAGTCVKLSGFEHRCKCDDGFSNLLNVTSFPCFRDCTIGTDCANLGFPLTNVSSPPNYPNGGGNVSSSQKKLLKWFILGASLAVVQAARIEL